jgi:hypothetical protein
VYCEIVHNRQNFNVCITLTYANASGTWILTKKDRKQMSIFERKVYRGIYGPVYENEKENWRILTNKEINETVK